MRLELGERRRPRRPLIPRRRVRVHRLDDRGPRDPQPRRDPCLRHPIGSQPPDQRPVLQSDHTPIVECSLFTAETVQFSSAADTKPHSTADSPRTAMIAQVRSCSDAIIDCRGRNEPEKCTHRLPSHETPLTTLFCSQSATIVRSTSAKAPLPPTDRRCGRRSSDSTEVIARCCRPSSSRLRQQQTPTALSHAAA